jgi:hypothetical protein
MPYWLTRRSSYTISSGFVNIYDRPQLLIDERNESDGPLDKHQQIRQRVVPSQI